MSDDNLDEIFRAFGHAAFSAYVFESALAGLAGTLRVMTHPYHNEGDIRQYDAHLRCKRTAGQLITQELTALTKGSPEWDAFLSEIADLRNRLMHRFYEEQLPNLHSESGRKFALKEVTTISMQLTRGAARVKSLYVSLAREHFAFDDECFRVHVEKSLKGWRDE